jgi:hypothetical protein
MAPSSTRTSQSSTTTTAATKTATGSSDVRVPATFVIKPGGRLAPAQITVPTHFSVQLTVVSGDGRSHRAVLQSHALTVPARGRASVLIGGLRQGRYPLMLDGSAAGLLLIGGQPGP